MQNKNIPSPFALLPKPSPIKTLKFDIPAPMAKEQIPLILKNKQLAAATVGSKLDSPGLKPKAIAKALK